MPPSADCPDSLEQVYELNRLFLTSLRSLDAKALHAAAFPSGAVGALRSSDDALLEAVSEFPRALFELVVADAPDSSKTPLALSSTQALVMTVVFLAWKISRDSDYHARLFFGMSPALIHGLRTTPLSELPSVALTRARIRCAFSEADWLWRELLTETRPEARRQLILIALQPSVCGNEPLSRVAEGGRS